MGPPEFLNNPYVYVAMIGFIAFLVLFFRVFGRFFKTKPANIIIAVKRYCYDYINEYLQSGGSINVRNKKGKTLLMIVADTEGYTIGQSISYVQILKMLEFLLSNGADPNLKDKYGQTALFFTADSPDCVALLLKHGADIDAQNNDGETVLMRAAKIRDYYVVKDFFEKGADPLIKDKAGKTAVQYAIEENHESIIEFFAEKGLDGSETGSEVMR